MDIESNVRNVRKAVAKAAARAGRDPNSIRVIAASKTFGPGAVQRVHALGIGDFGENRAVEARRKIPWCPPGITWHFIGYLQTNKINMILPAVTWIHSVDRDRLIDLLQRRCMSIGHSVHVLIQIKLSSEPSKTGCSEEAFLQLADRILHASQLQLRGLMTIPPLGSSPEATRPYYHHLAELGLKLEQWARKTGHPIPGRVELSMGMSSDYEVAIEEGSTMIRLGEALFGPRAYAGSGSAQAKVGPQTDSIPGGSNSRETHDHGDPSTSGNEPPS